MNFTRIESINPNSLRLFALFSGCCKENLSKKSALHLFVRLEKTKGDIQKAIVSHIPFDELNITVSEIIQKRVRTLSLLSYFFIIILLMILMWNIFSHAGIALSLVLFEKNIQKWVLSHLSNFFTKQLKNNFFNFIKSAT